MKIPITKKVEISDEFFGKKINDPYRWLENMDDVEVKNWVDSQNDYSNLVLSDHNKDEIKKELEQSYEEHFFSSPSVANGYYFYTEKGPEENKNSLYFKKGLLGESNTIVDMSKENNLSLDYWKESNSGKFVAYGLSKGGNEMSTLYIYNAEEKSLLKENIPNCRYSSISWLPDDSGFFYTRNSALGKIPEGEEHLHSKVFLHILGNDPDHDSCIFGKNRPKDDIINLVSSNNGLFLILEVSDRFDSNQVYLYDCAHKTVKQLFAGISAKFTIFFFGDKIGLLTNYQAKNYRILYNSIDKILEDIDSWQELIKEGKNRLTKVHVTCDKLILEYLVNASSIIIEFDHQGNKIKEIPLPPFSNVLGISTSNKEKEFFYSVLSFVTPKAIYRYNPKQDIYEIYKESRNLLNPTDFVAAQEWFKSKDGTLVPMFIVYKKGCNLDGQNPTILSAYGGFGSVEKPIFLRGFLPWISRGGIFALANIRGGGEFGSKWHEDAIKDKKQNSFDDFIAASEYLISSGYTSPDKLGIVGGSNGGLLVSAVAIQRPDIFKAVCARVPLTDMVRFHKFGIAMRWIHEYGNPETREEFLNIIKWSPYHNVKSGTEYPNFLFVTSENDTRVNPMHSRKMTALLQSLNKKNDVFLITKKSQGHSSHSLSTSSITEDQSIILSFFAKKLGLQI